MTNLKRFFAILCVCLFLFIGCFPCVAYAADDPPWLSSPDNVVINLVDDIQYLNEHTGVAIFEYFDYLYANNMSDGMQLFAFNLSIFGSGNTNGAANKTTLTLYFNNPDRPALYAYRSGSSLVVTDVGGVNSFGYSLAHPLLFGNVNIFSRNSTGSISNFFTSNQFYGYRDSTYNGSLTFGGSYINSNISSGNTDVLPWVVQSRAIIEGWISSYGSGGDIVFDGTYIIDIGSIFSSMMTSSMAIFDGFADYTLFGIDIKGSLICLLVIAIVIFVIKFLRGG